MGGSGMALIGRPCVASATAYGLTAVRAGAVGDHRESCACGQATQSVLGPTSRRPVAPLLSAGFGPG